MNRLPVTSTAAWHAAEVADAGQWTTTLTAAQRREVVDAAEKALAAGHAISSITRDDFALPALREELDAVVAALSAGRGFALLRGFPIDELSPEAAELAYVGLGLHLGTPVGQDAQGSLLGHVRDEGIARTGPEVRFYRTNQRQDFHTDGSDIVGLLCVQKALRGGESRIASSYAVYNEILRTRPDLLDVFYEPLCWDRNDEQSDGEAPYFELPVVHDIAGSPRIFYIGWYIRDAQRHPAVPRLTDEQLEAMDLLEATANNPRFALEMDFEPGDIQLLANAKILHSREAFDDHDDPARRRHLLRLWLTAHDFTSVDEALRGGIPTKRRTS